MNQPDACRNLLRALALLAIAILLVAPGASEELYNSNTPGDETLDVSGVDQVLVQSWGAEGAAGDSPGAAGGYREAEFDVSDVSTLYIRVGGSGGTDGTGGAPGGGAGGTGAGGGGGLSSVGTSSYDITNAFIVAGGGGGGGAATAADAQDSTAGAFGGADSGGDANDASAGGFTAGGGSGGGQSTGGTGGGTAGDPQNPDSGGDGIQGSGGDGGGVTGPDAGGGGGGAGWYGGGGGAAVSDGRRGSDEAAGAGGGGGSNYVDSALLLNDFANQQGETTGDGDSDGKVVIEDTSNSPPLLENQLYNGTDYDNLEPTDKISLEDERATFRANVSEEEFDIDTVEITLRNEIGEVKVSNASMANVSYAEVGGVPGGKYEYNETFDSFDDYNQNWSYTVWANDTEDEVASVTEEFAFYVPAELQVEYWNTTLLEQSLYETFEIEANVSCEGIGTEADNAECGQVEGGFLFDVFDGVPDSLVSTSAGDTPFFVSEQNPLSCDTDNLLPTDPDCQLSWTVNATESGSYNLGTNFTSDADYIDSNQTDSRKVETGLGRLNVNLLSPVNDPLTVSQNDTFWLNASVTCEGDSGDVCGDVAGSVRYTDTGEPDTLVNDSNDATPFHTVGDGFGTDNVTLMILWDGNSIPSDWSCLSCDSGDPFHNRFLRGNATYNDTGGSETHDHTAIGTSGEPDTVVTGNENQLATIRFALDSHTHDADVTDTASNIPEHRTLKLIAYDNGVPREVPNGAILAFDSPDLPNDWTEYTAQNDYFIKLNDTAGLTGGSNTHQHTEIYTESMSDTLVAATSTDGVSAAGDHSHTANENTDTKEHVPPHTSVVLAKADEQTKIPENAIGFFNTTPTENWNTLSENGEKFHGQFVKPNGTYGVSGGSPNHTHGTLSNVETDEAAVDEVASEDTELAGAHSHTFESIDFNKTDHLPPYTTVVIAQLEADSGTPNPQDCQSPLSSGDTCNLNWSINATGATDTDWFLDANFTSEYDGIEENNTADTKLCIESCPDSEKEPDITIHNPENTTITEDEPWLNVTADTDIDTWKYNLDATGNETFQPNITIGPLEDGEYNVTVWANSTDGLWSNSIRYFTVEEEADDYTDSASVSVSVSGAKTDEGKLESDGSEDSGILGSPTDLLDLPFSGLQQTQLSSSSLEGFGLGGVEGLDLFTGSQGSGTGAFFGSPSVNALQDTGAQSGIDFTLFESQGVPVSLEATGALGAAADIAVQTLLSGTADSELSGTDETLFEPQVEAQTDPAASLEEETAIQIPVSEEVSLSVLMVEQTALNTLVTVSEEETVVLDTDTGVVFSVESSGEENISIEDAVEDAIAVDIGSSDLAELEDTEVQDIESSETVEDSFETEEAKSQEIFILEESGSGTELLESRMFNFDTVDALETFYSGEDDAVLVTEVSTGSSSSVDAVEFLSQNPELLSGSSAGFSGTDTADQSTTLSATGSGTGSFFEEAQESVLLEDLTSMRVGIGSSLSIVVDFSSVMDQSAALTDSEVQGAETSVSAEGNSSVLEEGSAAPGADLSTGEILETAFIRDESFQAVETLGSGLETRQLFLETPSVSSAVEDGGVLAVDSETEEVFQISTDAVETLNLVEMIDVGFSIAVFEEDQGSLEDKTVENLQLAAKDASTVELGELRQGSLVILEGADAGAVLKDTGSVNTEIISSTELEAAVLESTGQIIIADGQLQDKISVEEESAGQLMVDTSSDEVTQLGEALLELVAASFSSEEELEIADFVEEQTQFSSSAVSGASVRSSPAASSQVGFSRDEVLEAAYEKIEGFSVQSLEVEGVEADTLVVEDSAVDTGSESLLAVSEENGEVFELSLNSDSHLSIQELQELGVELKLLEDEGAVIDDDGFEHLQTQTGTGSQIGVGEIAEQTSAVAFLGESDISVEQLQSLEAVVSMETSRDVSFTEDGDAVILVQDESAAAIEAVELVEDRPVLESQTDASAGLLSSAANTVTNALGLQNTLAAGEHSSYSFEVMFEDGSTVQVAQEEIETPETSTSAFETLQAGFSKEQNVDILTEQSEISSIDEMAVEETAVLETESEDRLRVVESGTLDPIVGDNGQLTIDMGSEVSEVSAVQISVQDILETVYSESEKFSVVESSDVNLDASSLFVENPAIQRETDRLLAVSVAEDETVQISLDEEETLQLETLRQQGVRVLISGDDATSFGEEPSEDGFVAIDEDEEIVAGEILEKDAFLLLEDGSAIEVEELSSLDAVTGVQDESNVNVVESDGFAAIVSEEADSGLEALNVVQETPGISESRSATGAFFSSLAQQVQNLFGQEDRLEASKETNLAAEMIFEDGSSIIAGEAVEVVPSVGFLEEERFEITSSQSQTLLVSFETEEDTDTESILVQQVAVTDTSAEDSLSAGETETIQVQLQEQGSLNLVLGSEIELKTLLDISRKEILVSAFDREEGFTVFESGKAGLDAGALIIEDSAVDIQSGNAVAITSEEETVLALDTVEGEELTISQLEELGVEILFSSDGSSELTDLNSENLQVGSGIEDSVTLAELSQEGVPVLLASGEIVSAEEFRQLDAVTVSERDAGIEIVDDSSVVLVGDDETLNQLDAGELFTQTAEVSGEEEDRAGLLSTVSRQFGLLLGDAVGTEAEEDPEDQLAVSGESISGLEADRSLDQQVLAEAAVTEALSAELSTSENFILTGQSEEEGGFGQLFVEKPVIESKLDEKGAVVAIDLEEEEVVGLEPTSESVLELSSLKDEFSSVALLSEDDGEISSNVLENPQLVGDEVSNLEALEDREDAFVVAVSGEEGLDYSKLEELELETVDSTKVRLSTLGGDELGILSQSGLDLNLNLQDGQDRTVVLSSSSENLFSSRLEIQNTIETVLGSGLGLNLGEGGVINLEVVEGESGRITASENLEQSMMMEATGKAVLSALFESEETLEIIEGFDGSARINELLVEKPAVESSDSDLLVLASSTGEVLEAETVQDSSLDVAELKEQGFSVAVILEPGASLVEEHGENPIITRELAGELTLEELRTQGTPIILDGSSELSTSYLEQQGVELVETDGLQLSAGFADDQLLLSSKGFEAGITAGSSQEQSTLIGTDLEDTRIYLEGVLQDLGILEEADPEFGPVDGSELQVSVDGTASEVFAVERELSEVLQPGMLEEEVLKAASQTMEQFTVVDGIESGLTRGEVIIETVSVSSELDSEGTNLLVLHEEEELSVMDVDSGAEVELSSIAEDGLLLNVESGEELSLVELEQQGPGLLVFGDEDPNLQSLVEESPGISLSEAEGLEIRDVGDSFLVTGEDTEVRLHVAEEELESPGVVSDSSSILGAFSASEIEPGSLVDSASGIVLGRALLLSAVVESQTESFFQVEKELLQEVQVSSEKDTDLELLEIIEGSVMMDAESQQSVFLNAIASEKFAVTDAAGSSATLVDLEEMGVVFEESGASMLRLQAGDEEILLAEEETAEDLGFERTIIGEVPISSGADGSFLVDLNRNLAPGLTEGAEPTPNFFETGTSQISLVENADSAIEAVRSMEESPEIVTVSDPRVVYFTDPEFQVVTSADSEFGINFIEPLGLSPGAETAVSTGITLGRTVYSSPDVAGIVSRTLETADMVSEDFRVLDQDGFVWTRTASVSEQFEVGSDGDKHINFIHLLGEDVAVATEDSSGFEIMDAVNGVFEVLPFFDGFDPDGGGAGVGGGEIEEGALNLEQEELVFTVRPNQTDVKNINFSLNSSSNQQISMAYSNTELQEFLRIERQVRTVSPGDSSVEVEAKAPIGVEPQVVEGDILFILGSVEQRVGVTVVVQELERDLLDVNLDLGDSYTGGEDAVATIEILNMGTTRTVDIFLERTVYNTETGDVVYSESEELAVDTSVSLAREFRDLEPGEYRVETVANYDNRTAESSSTFTVEEEQDQQEELVPVSTGNITPHVFTWLILLLTGVFMLRKNFLGLGELFGVSKGELAATVESHASKAKDKTPEVSLGGSSGADVSADSPQKKREVREVEFRSKLD